MVREIVKKLQNDDVNYYEFAGISTDTKPKKGVCTGSLFLEVNTGDVYAYNEASSGTWTKIASLGGS